MRTTTIFDQGDFYQETISISSATVHNFNRDPFGEKKHYVSNIEQDEAIQLTKQMQSNLHLMNLDHNNSTLSKKTLSLYYIGNPTEPESNLIIL